MKEFIEDLGGAWWFFITALSVIVTIVCALGMPAVFDTTNPWLLIVAGLVAFSLGFANGWKQRGFRNSRDIERADELERKRAEDADAKAAAEREREEMKRAEAALDYAEAELLGMQWPSQRVCLEAHELGETVTSDGTEAGEPNPYRAAARELGFVKLEACPNGAWRTVPTDKLESLIAGRPSVAKKVWSGVACETIPDMPNDWSAVNLVGNGAVIVPPKE